MPRRVLIISPVSTHPHNAGNSARVHQVAEALRNELACHVHFCLVQLPPFGNHFDERELRGYWQEELSIIETSWIAEPGKAQLGLMAFRLLRFVASLGKLGVPKWALDKMTNLVSSDLWFPEALGSWIEDFSRKWRPDAVVVEYALLSKAFEYLVGSPRKIIDTHDVFTDRDRRLKESGVESEWLSFTERQERKLVRRADIVIAIQEQEAKHFQRLTDTRRVKVIDVLSSVEMIRPAESVEMCIGYLGSANPSNRTSLLWFLSHVWPSIRKANPEARLKVGGGISVNFPAADGVDCVGWVEDKAEFYSQCRLIVNPCLAGTGLKIKSVESLVYGRPLVTTLAGCAGIEMAVNHGICVAENPGDFLDCCSRLLNDKEFVFRMRNDAATYIAQGKARSVEALNAAL